MSLEALKLTFDRLPIDEDSLMLNVLFYNYLKCVCNLYVCVDLFEFVRLLVQLLDLTARCLAIYGKECISCQKENSRS